MHRKLFLSYTTDKKYLASFLYHICFLGRLGRTTSAMNKVTLSKKYKMMYWLYRHKRLKTTGTNRNASACISPPRFFRQKGSMQGTTYISDLNDSTSFRARTSVFLDTEVLSRANLPSMFTLLRKRRLRWLGHVYSMEDGRIPKDIPYGELASGRRSKGRPQLRYKDVCKRDKEDLAADRIMWRSILNQHLKTGEERLVNAEVVKRTCTKERNNSNRPETTHTNATFVVEIVSPTSVSTTTSDAATIEQTGQPGQPGCTPMIKLDRRGHIYNRQYCHI